MVNNIGCHGVMKSGGETHWLHAEGRDRRQETGSSGVPWLLLAGHVHGAIRRLRSSAEAVPSPSRTKDWEGQELEKKRPERRDR